MSKRRVFVIGASGNVGKATINALSKNYGETLDIRAGVRNPEKVAEFNSLQGVAVVRAEMGKRDDLVQTFKDVDVLFIVVPGTGDRVQLTRVTAEAARNAGVKHIVSLGSASPTPDMAVGNPLRDIELIITSLGLPCTILRLPWFMENYFAFKETIQKSSMVYDAVEANTLFPAICMDDLGLAAAVIMSSPEKHTNKTYDMVSDRHSFNDLVKAFSEFLGKTVNYTQLSYEVTKAVWLQNGVPEASVDVLIEYWKAVNARKFAEGNDDDFTAITGKQSTSVTEWVQRYADVFKC